MFFEDRFDAGRQLAAHLSRYARRPDVVVLALPRGGVPVGYEVARALDAPLDIFLVRKIGVPGQEELALGAIASGGVRVLNEELVRALDVSEEEIAALTAREERELRRREQLYRGDRPSLPVQDRIVLLVDDGLATGASMRAAVKALRSLEAGWIVVAVPVGSPDTCRALRNEADDVICAHEPEPFRAVGLWYADFEQTSDEEVRRLLEEADHFSQAAAS
jgi:predicted phosphoribosyltransferase